MLKSGWIVSHERLSLGAKLIENDSQRPNVRLLRAQVVIFRQPELRSQVERGAYLAIFVVPLESVASA